jgi:hypothetical protein
MVATLEGLVEATRDIAHIDRSDIYYHLLHSYCKFLLPSVRHMYLCFKLMHVSQSLNVLCLFTKILCMLITLICLDENIHLVKDNAEILLQKCKVIGIHKTFR